ncbi:MAG: hypothetical protein ACE5HU_06070 [Acidobacteriota bacterium]
MRISILSIALLLLSASSVGTEARQAAPGPPAEKVSTTTGDEELESFIPSEEVRADSSISFPADI